MLYVTRLSETVLHVTRLQVQTLAVTTHCCIDAQVCCAFVSRVMFYNACTVAGADKEDGSLQLELLVMLLDSDASPAALSPWLRYHVLFAMVGDAHTHTFRTTRNINCNRPRNVTRLGLALPMSATSYAVHGYAFPPSQLRRTYVYTA